MQATFELHERPAPRHFTIVHRLRRRLRILAPSLRRDPERGYILDILLRKRPGIARVDVVPDIGSVTIHFDPRQLPVDNLVSLLDAVLPSLGRASARPAPAVAPVEGEEKEYSFAVEGLTCASCALLIELRLRRDPRVRNANVNLATESGTVRGVLSREEVFETVESLGYHAMPLDSVAQRKLMMAREDARLREAKRRAVWAAVLSVPVTIIAMADWRGRFWRWAQFLLTTPVVFWSGKPFFDKAVKLARQGTANMDTLIVTGVGSAWVYSTTAMFLRRPYLYFDAAAGIICFVLLGRYLEEKAKGRAHAAIRKLLDLQPQTAVLLVDGQERVVPVDDLVPGDLILVRPGDKIPTDGRVVEGLSTGKKI